MDTSNKIAIAALITALIAAILPYIIKLFQIPKIKGRIISLIETPSLKHSELGEGLGYVFKIALIVLNKNFDVKKVGVKIKYPNDENWYNGTIYRATNFSTTFSQGPDGKHQLNIPSEQDILSLIVLEKDNPVNYYLVFFVDKSDYKEFEEVELTFINYKDSKKKLNLYRKDISNINALFEKEVWEKIN